MIRAVFMGHNGSCGFQNNRNYELKTFIRPATEECKELIIVEDLEVGFRCGYGSLESFLENWRVLQINGSWY